MPYARKRKQGWQAVWTLPDGARRTETRRGWTKAQAVSFASEHQQKAIRTPWASDPGAIPKFSDYAASTAMDRIIRPSTAAKERSLWKRINAVFGEWPINTVAPSDIRIFIESLNAEGLSAAYVRDIYGLVALTFDYAVADELISQTPCVKVHIPKRTSRTTAASPGDVAALVDHIDVRYAAVVKFLAGTGARIGEALAVKVSDVFDVPRPSVRITGTVDGDGKIGPTKTESGVRTVTLPLWLRESLRIHITTCSLGPDDQLFPAPGGGVMPVRRFRSRYWNAACRDAGVEVTPHQLRHLHASTLIDAGRPLTEVAARLGHANPSVTMQVYGHWLRDDDSGSADVIPDYTTRLETG